MKTEITHKGMWWNYVMTCDRCGTMYNWSMTKEPNTEEADFCMDCLTYFLDNNIPYSIAKKQYKKEE